MPQVTYTPQEGLVQSVGSGMNLQGDMSGQKYTRKSITSTDSLTAADSGKCITLTGTAFTNAAITAAGP